MKRCRSLELIFCPPSPSIKIQAKWDILSPKAMWRVGHWRMTPDIHMHTHAHLQVPMSLHTHSHTHAHSHTLWCMHTHVRASFTFATVKRTGQREDKHAHCISKAKHVTGNFQVALPDPRAEHMPQTQAVECRSTLHTHTRCRLT